MNLMLTVMQVLTYTGLGILFTLVSVFPHSGKTVVNILRFLGVIFTTAVLIYLNLHLEFFAILLLMIYGGAIVVNILFAVLSYDITVEYGENQEIIDARVVWAGVFGEVVSIVLFFISEWARLVNERSELIFAGRGKFRYDDDVVLEFSPFSEPIDSTPLADSILMDLLSLKDDSILMAPLFTLETGILLVAIAFFLICALVVSLGIARIASL